jgi:hypothetical protein
MSGRGINKRAYHFPGLTIIVPEQTGKAIMPVNFPERIPENIPESPEYFTLIRIIANIGFFFMEHVEAKYFEEPVREFDPPIELRVNYNIGDINQIECDIHQLKLAYWDMERWVTISDTSHEYLILPYTTAQVAEAKIWAWADDPTVGWGK